ncbi:DUF262 domain-containing protein [uncultured Dysosmobacter sp.]|uniref:DUF262 domain-containing protein n=1 Tax=uncultured Dysosmobacter sp. TaxID=2591384 RepID=UPI002604ACAB|nr:DUF262 domain-containing protein [uncultured Dysosmobacter sp.]
MKNYLDTTTYNISWFKKAFDAGELEMSPPFQRNPVWTDKQKSYLIDSVLNGYPIPEIYIQEKISADGRRKYIIVDGQQRIRSVLGFIAGEFEISEGESDKWSMCSFEDLSEADRINFYSYRFVVRTLPDITDDEIRSIFQRINKNNVALNAQELRQSTYNGDFIKSMNRISDNEYWKDIGLFSAEKVRRMMDVEYISELAIAFLNGPQNKKDKLDYYYVMYETEYPDVEHVETVFNKVCSELIQVLPEIKKTRWSKLIDFYTLFLVMAEIESKLPLAQDKRDQLREKLLEFGNNISAYQKKIDDEKEDVQENVTLYASGIRNSSDLNARKNRFAALQKELFAD